MGKTLFEIFSEVNVDERKKSDDSQRPYTTDCAAVIANHKNGGIIVYAKPYSALWWEIQDVGSVGLGDYGLDLAPEGITVWEGKAVWSPGGYECPQDGQMDYTGKFRRLTAEEAAQVAAGQSLWTEEQDVDEDQRAQL